jgi:tRNA 2-thiouridine synthesizing protein E
MPFVEENGRKLEVNAEGFLVHPEEWTREAALVLAHTEEQLESLGPEHWAVIEYIRTYYQEKQLAPMVRLLCKSTGVPLKRIYELFPSGPAKGACKLAGLPKPDGCV